MGRVILGKDAANCADVNLDGTISLKDLTILKKHILGVENAGEDRLTSSNLKVRNVETASGAGKETGALSK